MEAQRSGAYWLMELSFIIWSLGYIFLNDGQVGQPKLGLIIHWLDGPSMVMLMVGPNWILFWEGQSQLIRGWGKICWKLCFKTNHRSDDGWDIIINLLINKIFFGIFFIISLHLLMNFIIVMKFLGLFSFDKERIYRLVLKLFMTKWYVVT